MNKLAALAAVAAVGLVAPAQAHKPDTAGKSDKAAKAQKAGKGVASRCKTRSVGFNASGTLLTSALTAGEDGRYSGTIAVTVTRANHGAPKGEQTYTLTNARVKFRAGVDAAAPAAGSRVKIAGKPQRLPASARPRASSRRSRSSGSTSRRRRRPAPRRRKKPAR